MTKKEKEFDFDTSYQALLDKAEELGVSEDLIFQTLLKEFKRMKKVCDDLYNGIEENGMIYVVEQRGQEMLKSNPLTKEYVSAHKTLVLTCGSIQKLLANISTSNDDWL